ncbi:MAG TPA: MAPEG family protein [Kiloniellales bacterium]|nr:MAPEG family protein [Kiloniellales bacterium]
MLVTITALYAGLLALLLVILALRVSLRRIRADISLGEGEGKAPELRRAVRMHGNAAETIPIGLILLLLVEMLGYSAYILHGIGGALLLGRLLHPLGLAWDGRHFWARRLGMILTGAAIIVAALLCLLSAASSF